MAKPEQERTIHLSEYYQVLIKHKWLIMGSLILAVTLTAFITFRMVPVYRATCVMVIENERSISPLTGQRTENENYFSQSLRFSTHTKLITSRPVIQRVIKKLKLDKSEQEKPLETSPIKKYIASLKQNIRILSGQPKKELTPGQKLERLIKSINKKIRIEPVQDTHLLNISADDHDPELARDIANSLVQSYIEFNLDNRTNSSRNTLSWMSNQLYETQKKLEKAEEEFLAFKQQEKLFSLEEKQKGVFGKITNIDDISIETRNRRVELETKLNELERVDETRVDAQHARTLISNPLIDSVYSQLLNFEIEMSRLQKVYKSKHPKIIQVRSSIENARKKFRAEIQKEVINLKAELAVLTQKEAALKTTVEDFESDALTTNRKELKYTILQRNVDTHQRFYDILLQRIKEANITDDIDVSNIRITEPAVTPLAPINPNKLKKMFLGVFLGLMIGIGLAFLLEYLDKTLRTEEDIRRHLDLPVLGVIPEAEQRTAKKPVLSGAEGSIAMNLLNGKRARPSQAAPLQRNFMDAYPTKSSFAEAYRTLRTNIQFSSMDKRLQSFVMTSAIAKEGKTLTTANTAYALAQTGKSVLMVDSDLRKPALSSLAQPGETPGLTGLLSDVFGTDVRNGSLTEFQIGDLFRLLTMQKKTGVLSLYQENEQVELLFFMGKLVDLNWMTRPEDKKLASVLISNGMITEGQAKQAFTQQKTTGQKLGFILLNLGLLKEEELTGPLTVHLMEGLRKAIGFNSGRFSFEDRSESDFEPSAFDPVDFKRIYKQLIIGEEPIAYLKEKISAAIVKTNTKGLFMLPSGNIPPNPSELLSSDRMSFLLSILRKRFDFLVIDAPPIIPASDALLIAPHVDGVLLVVKSGSANMDLVIKTVEKLQMAKTNILGVALNYVNIKKAGYYKYYFIEQAHKHKIFNKNSVIN